jgi:hypothetical protein
MVSFARRPHNAAIETRLLTFEAGQYQMAYCTERGARNWSTHLKLRGAVEVWIRQRLCGRNTVIPPIRWPFELWQLERQVATFEHKPKSKA